jgi:Na+/H+ antiporter NhaD/arsenite permease-like protein
MLNGGLLAIFAMLDRWITRRDPAWAPGRPREPLQVEGKLNLVWLLGVVATVVLIGAYGQRGLATTGLQIFAMAALAGVSVAITPRRIHEANRFTWGPIHEVAAVFIGIFVTMVPALAFMQEHGASLGITRPWQFFWASGALSSVLDNAPTYLTFASLATGVANAGTGQLSMHDLGALAVHPIGERLLEAVSCGSVFMGAVTYIGTGPNFMVKAIAEQHHVRMPGFFGYILWSAAILLPLLGAVALLRF